MRISAKGQLTIPIAVREAAGLMPETDVDVVYEDGVVKVVRSNGNSKTRGERLVEHMRGRGDFKMSTDEIMALMRGED